MKLLEAITQDIKKAMIAKEKEKLEALRAVKSAILLLQTEKGADLEISAEAEIKLLQRLIKQRKDAADIYLEQARGELANTELYQVEIIQAYLPAQLSEAQIREKLTRIIKDSGAVGSKDVGKVMGIASKELAGKVDNKVLSAIVKELLS